MLAAVAFDHDPHPTCAEVSTTLATSARVAFEAFTDVGDTPRWLPVIQTARVVSRGAHGRPTRAAFLARMNRAAIGYTLDYQYAAQDLVVSWQSAPDRGMYIGGEARFAPLSARASLMTYRLVLELPPNVEWGLAQYQGHPASAVVADFREHIRRMAG